MSFEKDVYKRQEYSNSTEWFLPAAIAPIFVMIVPSADNSVGTS